VEPEREEAVLRRTVARAFAARAGERLAAVDPGAPRTRREAVRRLFRALRDALAGRGAVVDPEGREFVLDAPPCSYRFAVTPSDAIEVQRAAGGRVEAVEVLSVQRRPDGFTPIRKASGARTAFRFTTLAEIVDSYAPRRRGRGARGSALQTVPEVDGGR
jgi:hypothetical protein